MIPLEEKIRKILADAYIGKQFDFAAIIEREDHDGRWDLVVSAPWIDRHQFIETVAPRLSRELSDKELINLGIMETLQPTSEFMQEYNQRIGPTDKDRDLFNLTIAGISMRHAHVFGAQTPLMYA
jgi:hypothetical protein